MDGIHRVHLIGIGGIGVSALARLFLHWGSAVSGSDVKRSEITDELGELGVVISIGHAAENIPADVELVVYSPAVPADNPERVEATRRGILQKSYPEMLGALMAGKYGEFDRPTTSIAVSGTNGKTTTTALLGHILVEAGLDPTVIVGSKVNNFGGSNLRAGQGPSTELRAGYFVVEGCEYRRHFLNLRPKMIVLMNIEPDHLDYFKDFDDIKAAFREYVALLPPDGTLVYNTDDPTCREIASTCRARTTAYGHCNVSFHCSGAGTWLAGRGVGEGGQVLRVAFGNSAAHIVDVPLCLPGEIYAMNALAAIAAAHALGVSPAQIAEAVRSFRGTWRRFEVVCGHVREGKLLDPARSKLSDAARSKPLDDARGKIIVSDYAHHPTAVRETIKAAREFFPGRRILVVFQPHQRNRTKNLLDGFVESLAFADQVIVCEIFDVSGREEDIVISSHEIATRLQRTGRPAQYAADLLESERLIRDELNSVDVVLLMGAGDIYLLGSKLC